MAIMESQHTAMKPRKVKVLMVTVTEPLANALFGLSNIVLIVGAAAVLLGTIGAIMMGSAKEQFASERISANEAETARAKADAEAAKEGAAQANARASEADLARARLEGRLAPRTVTPAALGRLKQAVAPFKGAAVLVADIDANAEARAFVASLESALSASGLNVKHSLSSQTIGGGAHPPISFSFSPASRPLAEAIGLWLVHEGLTNGPVPASENPQAEFSISVSQKAFP